jgi:hypothetical protein
MESITQRWAISPRGKGGEIHSRFMSFGNTPVGLKFISTLQ